MGGACRMHCGEEKLLQILVGNPEGSILKKQDG